jgi:hypothetical protein
LHLHRHDDGYVSFAVKSGDDFRPRISILRSELDSYFPEFISDFAKDSFVSINASCRLAGHHQRGKVYGYPKHDSANLRYLCACYTDIDYYNLGLDFGTALGLIVNYQDRGVIPPASIIVRSGQGMWLLWLLQDPKDPDQAQGAFVEKLELYARVQRAIYEKLASIGADPAARDPARYIRIRGSLHTGSEQYVQWWIQDSANSGFTYTLTELAQFFGAQAPTLNTGVKEIFEVKKQIPNNRRGWIALNERRLREFELLLALRAGGFDRGCRNRAAMLYAWLLRCNGWGRTEAASRVRIMAVNCRPPLTLSECRGAVKTGFGRKMRKVRDQTISDLLNITPDESAALEKFPPATRFQTKQIPAAPEPPIQNRDAGIQNRRLAISAIVEELGLFLLAAKWRSSSMRGVSKSSTLKSGRIIRFSI